MTNKLPEKLTALRKQFQLAQADVAEKVNVSVNEYMNWENGNEICSIQKLILLAKLYRIPVVDLLDNTKKVTLPDKEVLYESVEIPFIDSDKDEISYTNAIEIDEDVAQRIIEQTQSVPKVEEAPVDLGETRVLSADELQKTAANVIVEPKPTKQKEPKKKNLLLYIGLGVLGLLLLFLGIRFLTKGGGDDDRLHLSLSDTNRLALAEQFSAYVNNNNQLVTSGNAPSTTEFTDLVQVAAGNNHLVGLKKDGTVVCSGSSVACGVEDWNQITMIAAGNNHTVGLKKDGTVSCTGGAVACSVKSWEDITAVYAGSDITIGQVKDGGLKVSGNVNAASRIQEVKDAKEIAIGDSQIVVTHNDGSVSCYSIGTGSATNTSEWKNMKMATLGYRFIAGLDENGNVKVSSSDEEISKATQNWTGIRYIKGKGNTLVAVNNNHQIIGAGDNTYNQYGIDENDPNPSATADTKLGAINNVTFNSTSAGLTINWDEVKDADYYEVKINTTPEMTQNSVKNSVSVGSERLVDGTTYTISITPCSRDLTKYQNGETKTVTHQYKAAQVKLNAPQNVQVSQEGTQIKVTWDGVESAEFYNVTVETMTQQATATNFTIDGAHMEDNKDYTVFITAMSNNNRYSESDAGTATFTYKAPAIKVPLKEPKVVSATVDDNQQWIIKLTTDENAQSYTVTVNEKTYTTENGEIKVNPDEAKLVSGTEYLISVHAIPKDAEKSIESKWEGSFQYNPAPEVEPEPEPQEEPKEEEKEEEKKDG